MTGAQEPIVMGSSALLPGGAVLSNVHSPLLCEGRTCVIHAPTDHHMRTWPLVWRQDRGLFERTCPHGSGHPDPDQEPFWREQATRLVSARVDCDDPAGEIDELVAGQTTHGCDGCCAEPTP